MKKIIYSLVIALFIIMNFATVYINMSSEDNPVSILPYSAKADTEILFPSYIFMDEGCSTCTNEYGQAGIRFNCHYAWWRSCQTVDLTCRYGYC